MVSTTHIAAAARLRAHARRVVLAVAAFAAWSVLVWGGRIRNVVEADDLTGPGRAWRLALAAVFVLGGLVLGGALWSARRQVVVSVDAAGRRIVRVPDALRQLVAGLGLWTTAVWLLRGSAILVGDWDTGFKVVHTVLAVGSIALAVAAARAVGLGWPTGGGAAPGGRSPGGAARR